jgi:N-methylhydantoinase B/oxoprolinase/acetone carboxylase alpha subunit
VAVGTAADPVRLEIFNNLFMSIAEQMGVTLANTAYSVNIKERLDFSCALFDRAGRVTAVYVGFRSTAPQLRQSFSTEHYNFAVAVSASMRAALAELSQ